MVYNYCVIICTFGDSITWGPRLPFRVAWANLLRNHLEKNSDNLHSLYDLGIDKNTTTNLLERLEGEASARKPELIIFNIGVNDSSFRGTEDKPETTLDDFADNMQALIDKARSFTKEIMILGLIKGSDLLTTPLIQSTTGKSYTQARTKRYDAILKDVATKNGLLFIDINGLLTDADFDDGLHPNINGHIKIFDIVSRELDKILAIKHERYAVLVDKTDKEVGHKMMDALSENDIIRVSALWITNSRGEILLAKRPMSKRRDPNRWGPSVATIVEKDQTYLGSIKKAAKNEIGLEGFVTNEGKKLLVSGYNNFYCQLFSCQQDLTIHTLKLNQDEVQKVKWFSRVEIGEQLHSNPYHFVQAFDKYLELCK
ncbi:MAG: putative TesA-like protein protease [uncultured bacterium]|nr:MAG: putative TesA-like protein protease [uncultured bacterium]